MTSNYNYRIWLPLAFVVSLFVTKIVRTIADKEIILIKDAPTNSSCPDPGDIFPCECILIEGLFMDMDCSPVTTEDELKEIFSKPATFLNFRLLIIMYNNHLKTIRVNDLGKATFEQIRIYYGVVEVVEPKAFINSASTLQELTLHHNHITSFPFSELSQYTSLTELHLGTNNLTEYEVIESSSMRKICFDNNNLSQLPLEPLQKMPNLSVVSFTNCGLSEILPGTFTSSPHLHKLLINKNQLTHIQADTIEFHGTFGELNVESNKIYNISVNAIKGATGPLGIDYNNIHELNEDVWRPIIETCQVMWIDGNPLVCQCDIAWLIETPELLNRIVGNPKCANGTGIKDLDPAYYHHICD